MSKNVYKEIADNLHQLRRSRNCLTGRLQMDNNDEEYTQYPANSNSP